VHTHTHTHTHARAYTELAQEGKDVRFGDWTAKEIDVLNVFQLLTAKPVVYLVNLSKVWMCEINVSMLHPARVPGQPIVGADV